jgi:hypothetical protein
VQYTVTDGGRTDAASGDAALTSTTATTTTGWRLVRVVCPVPERFCVDGVGRAQCTVSGVCGLGRLAQLFTGVLTSPASPASPASSASSSYGSSSTAAWPNGGGGGSSAAPASLLRPISTVSLATYDDDLDLGLGGSSGGSASGGGSNGGSDVVTATSSGASSRPRVVVDAEGFEAAAGGDSSAPRIALTGPRRVEIPQDGSFDRYVVRRYVCLSLARGCAAAYPGLGRRRIAGSGNACPLMLD